MVVVGFSTKILNSLKISSLALCATFALNSQAHSNDHKQRGRCQFLIGQTFIRKAHLPRAEQVNLDLVQRPLRNVRDSIVAAIIHNGKVLMGKRGGNIGYGQWGVLGGKVDPGETLREGLMRELREEVDIHHLRDARVVFVHYHYDPVSSSLFRVFVVRAEIANSTTPRIMETDKILDLDWFPLDDVPAPLFSEFNAYRDQL